MFTNREIRRTLHNLVRDYAPTSVVSYCYQTLATTMKRLKVNPTAGNFQEFYENCFGNQKSQEFEESTMCTSVSSGTLYFEFIQISFKDISQLKKQILIFNLSI